MLQKVKNKTNSEKWAAGAQIAFAVLLMLDSVLKGDLGWFIFGAVSALMCWVFLNLKNDTTIKTED